MSRRGTWHLTAGLHGACRNHPFLGRTRRSRLKRTMGVSPEPRSLEGIGLQSLLSGWLWASVNPRAYPPAIIYLVFKVLLFILNATSVAVAEKARVRCTSCKIFNAHPSQTLRCWGAQRGLGFGSVGRSTAGRGYSFLTQQTSSSLSRNTRCSVHREHLRAPRRQTAVVSSALQSDVVAYSRPSHLCFLLQEVFNSQTS